MNPLIQSQCIYNEAYVIVAHRGLPFEVKLPDSDTELTQKLKVALEEVAKIERGERKATNARDFLDEL